MFKKETSIESKVNNSNKFLLCNLFYFFYRIELVKELVNQLENANDAAARSEVKILELLEKQTRLQEISMENEREFLNVFKNIMNNMAANK